MKRVWQLQEAKNRFSELVSRAKADGPQVVSKRGVEAVVVMSIEDYRRMAEPEDTLVEFFKNSPLRGSDLDLDRSSDGSREVDL